MAQSGYAAALAKRFGTRERKTTVGTEVRAGFTTFLVMAYIIFVNSNTVSQSNAALADRAEIGRAHV